MKKEKINFDERLIARGGRIWKISPALRLVLDGHDGLWKLSFQQPQRMSDGNAWEEASPKFVYGWIAAYDFDHFTLARSVLGNSFLIAKKCSWARNPGRSTRDHGYYFAIADLMNGGVREISAGYAAILIRQGAYEVLAEEATLDEAEN